MKPLSLLVLSTGIIFLLCSVTVPFQRLLPAWAYWDGSYVIKAGESEGPIIGLPWGTAVRGMLVISGGDNEIEFSVTHGEDMKVISKTKAANRYFFEFQAIKNSQYHFIFDNTLSLFTEKSVYWIVWVYWYNFAFFICGVSVLFVGVLYFVREEKKGQRRKTQRETLQDTEYIFFGEYEHRSTKGTIRDSAVLIASCIVGGFFIILGFTSFLYEEKIPFFFTYLSIHPLHNYAAIFCILGIIIITSSLVYTVMRKQKPR